MIRNEENQRQWRFSKVEHKYKNPVESLDYACINESLSVTMHQRKVPINMLSRSKAPKTQQVEHLSTSEKNQWTFLVVTIQGATLAPSKDFVYLGFFEKVSALVYLLFLDLSAGYIVYFIIREMVKVSFCVGFCLCWFYIDSRAVYLLMRYYNWQIM